MLLAAAGAIVLGGCANSRQGTKNAPHDSGDGSPAHIINMPGKSPIFIRMPRSVGRDSRASRRLVVLVDERSQLWSEEPGPPVLLGLGSVFLRHSWRQVGELGRAAVGDRVLVVQL